MKAGKTPGPDSVLPSVSKSCANELSKTFCEIFNASLQECVVPAVWKMSSIKPVPKNKHLKYESPATYSVHVMCYESV